MITALSSAERVAPRSTHSARARYRPELLATLKFPSHLQTAQHPYVALAA
jgi:hypothetical protein